MKMPMNGGEGSRHVGFAPEPVYSRRPRVDEEYVMEHFHKHAQRCDDCHDPYKTYKKGGTLCDQGHRLAQDVAGYLYSKGGRAYSMLDRESLRQRVQVEIPPHCDKVRGLLQAVDHGLRVQKTGALKSQDKNYYVPTRPDRRSYHDDRHEGPVKEPKRRHDEERRYHDDRRNRSDPNYQRAERHRYPEKRQSMPSHYAPYGSLWETDSVERKYQQSYYDGNPVYYYKPSRGGKERRIPRSESPKHTNFPQAVAHRGMIIQIAPVHRDTTRQIFIAHQDTNPQIAIAHRDMGHLTAISHLGRHRLKGTRREEAPGPLSGYIEKFFGEFGMS